MASSRMYGCEKYKTLSFEEKVTKLQDAREIPNYTGRTHARDKCPSLSKVCGYKKKDGTECKTLHGAKKGYVNLLTLVATTKSKCAPQIVPVVLSNMCE